MQICVNESGFYSLSLGSKKPRAKQTLGHVGGPAIRTRGGGGSARGDLRCNGKATAGR